MFRLLLCLCVYLHQSMTMHIDQATQRHPVILVPAILGSKAYIRPVDRPDLQPTLLWLNLTEGTALKRFANKFRLRYNNQTHELLGNPDYEITFPGLGDTDFVEYPDMSTGGVKTHFGTTVEQLLKDPYFRRNVTLRGIPYDFRKPPEFNPEFMEQLRELIEETYRINENQRVILVGYSLGALYAYQFLESQPGHWKQQHIKAYVSLGGPYGGTMLSLKSLLSGHNLGISFIKPMRLRRLQRGMPSVSMMIPDPAVWPEDQIVVSSPQRNYTAHEWEQLWRDVNYTAGYDMWRSTKRTDYSVRPSHVDEVYCIHGMGNPTIEQLIYPATAKSTFSNQEPEIIYGEGDGTVNLRSLDICSQWPNSTYVTLPKVKHDAMDQDDRFNALLQQIAGAQVE